MQTRACRKDANLDRCCSTCICTLPLRCSYAGRSGRGKRHHVGDAVGDASPWEDTEEVTREEVSGQRHVDHAVRCPLLFQFGRRIAPTMEAAPQAERIWAGATRDCEQRDNHAKTLMPVLASFGGPAFEDKREGEVSSARRVESAICRRTSTVGEETKARSVACRSKVAVVGSAWRRGPKRPRQPGDYFSLTTWAQVTRCHRALHLGILRTRPP